MIGAEYGFGTSSKSRRDVEPSFEQLEMEALAPELISTEKSESESVCEARESTSAPTSTARDYGLDEKTATVFEAIPCKSPVSVDRIACQGLSTSDIITALTMLEIMGLVSSLPGGLYMRN